MTLREKLSGDFAQSGSRWVWDVVSHPGNFAVFVFRLSSAAYAKGGLGKVVGALLFRFNRFFSHCEISPAADIGPGFNIVHPFGIVIAPVTIGRNFVIYHGVTIGQKRHGLELKEWPTVGDNVIAYAGSVIAGAVTIGEGARIGANVVVVTDVPARATVLPAAVRIVGGEGATSV